MSLLIGFLTFVLVLNCLFLMLLVLIQLPKKEAGAGIAFGGAATDALFGAGSGNALTQLTKYSASLFVGLSVLLSTMNMHAAREGSRRLEQELSRQASAPAPAPAAPVVPKAPQLEVAPPLTPSSNAALQTPLPLTSTTNSAVLATPAPPITSTSSAAGTTANTTPAPAAPATTNATAAPASK